MLHCSPADAAAIVTLERREDILGMEKKMLASLQYDLTVPTCYLFTARFRKAAGVQDQLKARGMHARIVLMLLLLLQSLLLG